MTASKDDDTSALSLNDLVSTVGDIAAAYLSNPSTRVEPDSLNTVIRNIYEALVSCAPAAGEWEKAGQSGVSGGLTPAVPIKKSVTEEFIICLEDGKKLKTLKRYLEHKFNLTPEQYRKRWNLPASYPMTAPAYSKQRSNLARKVGLGTEVNGRSAGRP